MDLRQRNLLRKRLTTFQVVVWLMMLGLGLVYAWLQVVRRSELEKLALSQAVKVRATPAPRGIIFDRNGHRLVDNRKALHLVIQQEDLPKDPAQVESLAQALEQDPEQLNRRVQMARSAGMKRSLVVQDNLDDTGLARAENLRARFPFLSIEVAPRRVYQGDELAAHVLGYVGEVNPQLMSKDPGRYQLGEIVGRSGFEAAKNDLLKGQDGQRKSLVDQLGREVALYGLENSTPGQSVYLTLDSGLQKTMQDAFGEERGAGVVIDLRDGGILALYSSPSFDPNAFLSRMSQEKVDQYVRNPTHPMLDRATQGLYSPGSTYKLLIALCALEKGIITPETTFTCHGKKAYYGREFRCDGVHGTVNLVQAIARSCDVYFYELGIRLDVDEIHATAVKYGLTELTQVDLPNELPSRIPSREWKAKHGRKEKKWYAGETISVAIGQGQNGVTPIALARFYAMLGAKGKVLTPHLLYGLRDGSGQMEIVPPPKPREAGLDPKIWAALDEGLYEVVRSGTAHKSALPGVTMCGKTGTSQVTTFVDKAHYRTLAKQFRDNALFAGYAPRENPQIAWAIVVENAGFGAEAAAPIGRKLCQYWFLDRLKKPLPAPGGKLPDAFDEVQSDEAEPKPELIVAPEAPAAKAVPRSTDAGAQR